MIATLVRVLLALAVVVALVGGVGLVSADVTVGPSDDAADDDELPPHSHGHHDHDDHDHTDHHDHDDHNHDEYDHGDHHHDDRNGHSAHHGDGPHC